MLHEQLEWVIKHPPSQPCLKLSVKVDTQSYRDQSEKPPSALKHRSADMPALADTGCQAVCMGPEQLHSVGLSVGDLMPVDLRLSGANGSSIRILGGVFISITGVDTRGKKWSTKHQADVVEAGLCPARDCQQQLPKYRQLLHSLSLGNKHGSGNTADF